MLRDMYSCRVVIGQPFKCFVFNCPLFLFKLNEKESAVVSVIHLSHMLKLIKLTLFTGLSCIHVKQSTSQGLTVGTGIVKSWKYRLQIIVYIFVCLCVFGSCSNSQTGLFCKLNFVSGT